MQILLIIISVILSAACGVLAYAFRSARRAQHEADARTAGAESGLRDAAARNAELSELLRGRELELVAARKDIETLTARLDEEGKRLKEKNDMLMLQFEKTANDIFERKTLQFKETNRESLDIILKPLKDNISDFKRRVEEITPKRTRTAASSRRSSTT